MRSIINELWHGNIVPQEDSRTNSKELKASDPMRWVRLMNNIKALAEEIVLKEVVYK